MTRSRILLYLQHICVICINDLINYLTHCDVTCILSNAHESEASVVNLRIMNH